MPDTARQVTATVKDPRVLEAIREVTQTYQNELKNWSVRDQEGNYVVSKEKVEEIKNAVLDAAKLTKGDYRFNVIHNNGEIRISIKDGQERNATEVGSFVHTNKGEVHGVQVNIDYIRQEPLRNPNVEMRKLRNEQVEKFLRENIKTVHTFDQVDENGKYVLSQEQAEKFKAGLAQALGLKAERYRLGLRFDRSGPQYTLFNQKGGVVAKFVATSSGSLRSKITIAPGAIRLP